MQNIIKRTLFLAAIVVLIVMTGCVEKTGSEKEKLSGKITVAGSTALKPFLEASSAEFIKQNPGVTINIMGGGSVLGQKQSVSGAIDIGASDFPLPETLKENGMAEFRIARIPFVFIVNKQINITNLSKAQITNILEGKISNWKELGDKEENITIFHRPKFSGARNAINSFFMRGNDFSNDAIVLESNMAVRDAVVKTKGGIGYVDGASADSSVNILAYEGINYTYEKAVSGNYPIWSYGCLFTKANSGALVNAFINFIKSESVQKKILKLYNLAPVNN